MNIFASNKISSNTGISIFDINTDISILLFKGISHNGIRKLTSRFNSSTGYRYTKAMCKDSFDRLAFHKLRKV